MTPFLSAYRCGCGTSDWVFAAPGTEGGRKCQVWCLGCYPGIIGGRAVQ